MPEFCVLTTAGFQVPVMPLSDVFGNVGTDPPAHILRVVPNANVGTILGLTVTASAAVVAHRPAVGVKI